MSPRGAFVLQLGIAALTLFMGGTVVLMAVGLITPDDPPSLGGRVVAFLFGCVVLGVGSLLVVPALGALAAAAGARGGLDAVALGLRRLAARITWHSLAAAALLVPLVWAYWRELQGHPLGRWSRDTLIGLVALEFLLIHGFPFLVIAASFARTPEGWPRLGGIAAVAGLLLLYSAFAWGVGGGPGGVATLCYLVLPNVLAFAHRAHDWTVRATAAARWVEKFITLFGIAMVLDERSLRGAGNLRLGLFYFGIQALIELVRGAELPLDLGAAWARLPEERRRRHALVQPTTHDPRPE
ncbi:MAG: hypothetical protein ACREMR_00490 [Gemmatimonadales bacterium]